MLSGHATADGTSAYAERFPQIDFRPLGGTDLLVSPAGFGGYRVDTMVGDHHRAVRHALLNGINLVDTSSNYAGGGSEELFGTVLRWLHEEGGVSREAVVVVSKGGYLQGSNYQLSQQRKADGRPFPDLVEYGEGLEHCIHPEFLEDQLARSLRRLKLATLDVYLLHNPEYYLTWAQRAGRSRAEAREEYYRRLELAFGFLEQEVARGRIGCYGVSSNTFPAPATAYDHSSLARMWEIAGGSGDHHFRVVQLPMNLLEPGAAVEENQPGAETALAFARARDLAVLVNRPLNAFAGNRLFRLADFPQAEPVAVHEVEATVDELAASEAHFRDVILPALPVATEVARQLTAVFSAGQLLQGQWQQFNGLQHWAEVQTRYLVPRSQSGIDFLTKMEEEEQAAMGWLREYVARLNEAMNAVEAFYRAAANRQGAKIRQQARAADAVWDEAPTLSQVAIRALRSTAGVTSVLVGMRRVDYVDDVLAELSRDVAIAERRESWQQMSSGQKRR